MEELNFPVIKCSLPPKKQLSMEDYVRFVVLNLNYTIDIDANRKWKRLLAVNEPFVLR